MELKNKKVVVVGGSSGIGFAVAKAAAAKGAHVIIASRVEEKVKKAAAEIGKNVEARVLDVRKEEEVKAFFDKIGTFDHLVCTTHPDNSSLFRDFVRLIDEVSTSAFREFMEVKFWGQYYCAKYGARKLSPKGSITLTGGGGSKSWVPNHGPVAAINAAVGALATRFAKEIGPKRVNCVAAGLVNTPAQGFLSDAERQIHFKYKAEILPVKHVAEPEEVALSYIYLMECDFHTADVLVVDGGNTMVGPESPGYKDLKGRSD
jgi:NAD(P)-dependent dehydrogenase (short-subunit alcohol dehydrogenase family)